MKFLNAFLVMVSILMISTLLGCTWVKPTEEGAGVRISPVGDVAGCRHISIINVSVKDRIGRLNRKASKVATELATLARNEGAVMGGNTVVTESEVEDGRQEFSVYHCP